MRLLIHALVLLFCAMLAAPDAAAAADPAKVLRLASPDIDTLDPHQYNDNPSFEVQAAIFEGLYEWDYLASPAKLAPNTAAALPEMSADGLTWTMRVKPGIHFTPDPAFGGKPRELTAADYVYSYQRWLDPNLRRGGAPITTNLIVGMREAVDAARRSGKFDHDRPIEGLRALDRYTLQLKLTEVNYPIIQALLSYGACAREVVEAAGGDIRTRAVGTGPYRLREWKRGSRIVLEAKPAYRALRFPASRDPAHAALVRQMEGKALPQIGKIEISFIDEDMPRVLEFESGGLDVVVLRSNVVDRMLVEGKLRPELAARGVARLVVAEPYAFLFYFNIADPVIGGMGRERIALRRAMALATDVDMLVRVVYAGQALPASQLVPPNVGGHDPARPNQSLYDPAAAKALLDRFGYDKRDADGYRRAPDGKPLSLMFSLRASVISREVQTLIRKNMAAIGLRMDFHVTPFQDLIKELEAGKFQLYFGGYGGLPSGDGVLLQLYSRAPRTQNFTQFALPEYDRAMEKFLRTGDEAEQRKLALEMTDFARAYMPQMPVIYRLENDFVQPWVQGYAPQLFTTYWKYLDIDLARKARSPGRPR